MLLEHGANANTKEMYGNTPLHHAVRSFSDKPCISIIKMLLDSGANINAQNKSGKTPLHVVSYQRQGDYSEIIKILLELGADVNAQDNKGKTFLHNLVCDSYIHDNSKLITLLLNNGADPYVLDKEENTETMNEPEYFENNTLWFDIQRAFERDRDLMDKYVRIINPYKLSLK
jgi:ankyrin repeat protein